MEKIFIIDDVFPTHEKKRIEQGTNCEIISATSYEEAEKIITEAPEGEAIADLCICDCCFEHPLWKGKKEDSWWKLQQEALTNYQEVLRHFAKFLLPIESKNRDFYLSKLAKTRGDDTYLLTEVLCNDCTSATTAPDRYFLFNNAMKQILQAHYYLPINCGGPGIALKLKQRGENMLIYTSGIKHSFSSFVLMIGLHVISVDEVMDAYLNGLETYGFKKNNLFLSISETKNFAMGGDKKSPETWVQLINLLLT